MSVVNDVLKNLNQRHVQGNVRGSIAYMAPQDSPKYYWLLGALLATLFLCAGFALNIFYQVNKNKLILNLPADLFVLDTSVEPISKIIEITKETKLLSVSNVTKSPKVAMPPKVIVTKTAQTVAVNKAVIYINKGNDKAARSILAKTPKVFQDEVKLRLMIKENPSAVFPYIKHHYKNYEYQTNLLAIAAQAEQRSSSHENAIGLYKRLIEQEPHDARWRAGIAISLEVIGELKAAKHMYALAMNMPNLPLALKSFSKQRLAILR